MSLELYVMYVMYTLMVMCFGLTIGFLLGMDYAKKHREVENSDARSSEESV
jgi:hypothetical protein